MHRALEQDEIVHEIFSWVDKTCDALAAALAGRAFCDLALQAVWRRGSEWWLARSMPAQSWRMEKCGRHRYIALTDAPRTSDWRGPRFSLYARSLRSLTLDYLADDAWLCGEWGTTRVHPSVLRAWAEHRPVHGCVFPGLHELILEWVQNADPSLVVALAGSPSLKSVEMAINCEMERKPTAGLDAFIRIVAAGCSYVSSFELDLENCARRHPHSGVSSSIASWTSLRHVSLCHMEVGADLLEAFAHLPYLHTLELESCEAQGRPNVHVLLPCLRSVTAPIKLLIALRYTLDAPTLRSVHARATNWELEQLQHLTRSLERHEQLEEVGLHFYRTDPLSNLESSFEASLPRVRRAQLTFWHNTRWDHGVAAIAHAYPALETLYLSCSISWETVTLVLTCCPLLQRLEATIDFFSPLPSLPSWSGPGDKGVRALSELHLQVERWNDIPDDFDLNPTALFLQALCPRVLYTAESLRTGLQKPDSLSRVYLRWNGS